MEATFYVEGRLHLSLETVAQIYEVDLVWLRSAYDAGLIGEGVIQDRAVGVPALRLDRIATIVRLQHFLGGDLEVLAATLIED